jgi:hypothetical protein
MRKNTFLDKRSRRNKSIEKLGDWLIDAYDGLDPKVKFRIGKKPKTAESAVGRILVQPLLDSIVDAVVQLDETDGRRAERITSECLSTWTAKVDEVIKAVIKRQAESLKK